MSAAREKAVAIGGKADIVPGTRIRTLAAFGWADLPLRVECVRELENVQVKITAAGNQVQDAGGGDHHADMMVACAFAYYRSELKKGCAGEEKLDGW